MPAENDVRARVAPRSNLLDVVNHEDGDTPDVYLPGFGNTSGPLPPVIISAHRDRGSQHRELFQNLRIADITGVKDQIHALEELQDLRPQEAVGIGYGANNRHDVWLRLYRFQFGVFRNHLFQAMRDEAHRQLEIVSRPFGTKNRSIAVLGMLDSRT